jgi:hypothetical protein
MLLLKKSCGGCPGDHNFTDLIRFHPAGASGKFASKQTNYGLYFHQKPLNL